MKYILLTTILLLSIKPTYQKQIDKYIIENQSEKVYLHLDKKYYGSGDNLWFKSYLVNSVDHIPSTISKTLYVELLNSQGTVIDSLVLFSENGTSDGNFKLSKKLKSGEYQVRAYTNWMRNFDDEFIFRKNFKILNPLNSSEESNANVPNDSIYLDFLPEGGDLIDGIGSKVAIKAYDKFGFGVSLEGVIKSKDGATNTDFNTNELGMGEIYLTPSSDSDYYAETGGKNFSLPQVKSQGASIKVIHSHGNDKIIITVLSKNVDLAGGTLVAHQRGQFLFAVGNTNSESFATRISRKNLKPGIIHLTYFNSKDTPLTERLIYPLIPQINSELKITSDENGYQKRSQVSLNIALPDSLIHSASLVINPANENHYTDGDANIVTELMLTSDLKGRIENPGIYFEGTSEAYKRMDLLMMTQGWTRFNWKEVLNNSGAAKKYGIEKGLTIKGQVVDYYNKEKTRQGSISMTSSNNGISIAQGKTNPNGEFIIENNLFFDSTRLILQATGFRGKRNKAVNDVSIQLLNNPKLSSGYGYKSRAIDSQFEKKVQKQSQIAQAYFLDDDVSYLDEVVVKTQRITEQDERAQKYGDPSNRIIADEFRFQASTVLDMLSRTAGVTVTGSGASQSASIRGFASLSGIPPLYILDGMQVDLQTILTIPIQQVDFVDVLKGPNAAFYGVNGAGGVIVVYTKTGESSPAQFKESKGLLVFTHPGYHASKQFYSPQYAIPEESHNVPDFRSTLYWNPELKFENGTANVEFFTSDQLGKFDIRVEGLMKDGSSFVNRSSIVVE
ncbi:TonB-dependent receptor [Ekhidna sp.]